MVETTESQPQDTPREQKRDDEDAPTPSQLTDRSDLHKMLFYSLLGGLCPLIPIPFLDDLLIKQIRLRMFKTQIIEAGLKLSDAQLDTLSKSPGQGCLRGCLIFIIIQGPLYILKKIFRKIFFFLAVKDAVDITSKLLHEGWLVQHMLTQSHLNQETLTDSASLEKLRDAMLATCEEMDTRPLNQILRRFFRGSKAMVYKAVNALGSLFKKNGFSRKRPQSLEQALDTLDKEDESTLNKLLASFSDVLEDSSSQAYFKQLQLSFETHLNVKKETDQSERTFSTPDADSRR